MNTVKIDEDTRRDLNGWLESFISELGNYKGEIEFRKMMSSLTDSIIKEHQEKCVSDDEKKKFADSCGSIINPRHPEYRISQDGLELINTKAKQKLSLLSGIGKMFYTDLLENILIPQWPYSESIEIEGRFDEVITARKNLKKSKHEKEK